jgi:Cu/Ag efflux protein CusF
MKTVMMFAAGVLIGVPPLLLAQHHAATTAGKPVATEPKTHAAAHPLAQTVAVVEAVDGANRTITLKGPRGTAITYAISDEVRNLSEVKVGDPVIAVYVQPLVLEVKKAGSTGIRERIERERAAGGAAAREVAAVADVICVSPRMQTVTLRGPKETVEMPVKDPAQIKNLKQGDQVEATYTDAVVISLKMAR